MGLFETRPPPTPAFIIISEVYCIPYFQTQGGSPVSATGFILRFILGPRSLKRNAIIHINQIAAYVCSFPGQHLRKDQENRGELTLYNFLWSLLNIFSIYLGPPKYPPKHGKSTRTMSLPSDNQRWLAGNSRFGSLIFPALNLRLVRGFPIWKPIQSPVLIVKAIDSPFFIGKTH